MVGQEHKDPIEKLHKGLVEDGLFSGTIDDFKRKYSTPKAIDELYNDLKVSGDFTKDKFAFYHSYFPQHREEAAYDRFYKGFKSDGYEGSEKDFRKEFGTDEGRDKLYKLVSKNGEFSGNQDEFNSKYFPQSVQKKKMEADFNNRFTPFLQKKNTSSTSQGGELPSASKEPDNGMLAGMEVSKPKAKSGELKGRSGYALPPSEKDKEELSKKYGEAAKHADELWDKNGSDIAFTLAKQKKRNDLAIQEIRERQDRGHFSGMDNQAIQGVFQNIHNEIQAKPHIDVTPGDVDVMKADIGHAPESKIRAAHMADPENKEIAKSAYILDHGVNGRFSEDVKKNAEGIEKGDLVYKNGQLLKPEGFWGSLGSGAETTLDDIKNSIDFFAKDSEGRKAQYSEELQKGPNPDKPIPVPKNMLGSIGSTIGGVAPMAAAAAATGGSSLAGALTFGLQMGVTGGKRKLDQLIQEKVSNGMDVGEAYDQSIDEAAKAGVVDYAVGAGMGYAGANADGIVGKPAMITPEWDDALISASRKIPGGHFIKKLAVEAPLVGTEAAVGEKLKGESSVQATEAAISNMKIVAAFGAVTHLINQGGKAIRVLSRGLGEVPPEQIDLAAKAAVESGEYTQEQVDQAKAKIQEVKETDSKIPETVRNESVRAEVGELIDKRDALEEKKKTEDAAFAPKTKEKIDALNEKIVELSNSKEAKEGPEPVKEQPTVEKTKEEESKSLSSDLASIFGNKEKEAEALQNELGKLFPQKESVEPPKPEVQESVEAKPDVVAEKETALKESTKPEPTMEFLQKSDLRKLKDLEGGVKEHDRIKDEFKRLKSIVNCLWA